MSPTRVADAVKGRNTGRNSPGLLIRPKTSAATEHRLIDYFRMSAEQTLALLGGLATRAERLEKEMEASRERLEAYEKEAAEQRATLLARVEGDADQSAMRWWVEMGLDHLVPVFAIVVLLIVHRMPLLVRTVAAVSLALVAPQTVQLYLCLAAICKAKEISDLIASRRGAWGYLAWVSRCFGRSPQAPVTSDVEAGMGLQAAGGPHAGSGTSWGSTAGPSPSSSSPSSPTPSSNSGGGVLSSFLEYLSG